MYFKKLIGKKCYLSPIDVNDAPIYTAWLNDSEVNANLTLASSVISLETEKEFLQKSPPNIITELSMPKRIR